MVSFEAAFCKRNGEKEFSGKHWKAEASEQLSPIFSFDRALITKRSGSFDLERLPHQNHFSPSLSAPEFQSFKVIQFPPLLPHQHIEPGKSLKRVFFRWTVGRFVSWLSLTFSFPTKVQLSWGGAIWSHFNWPVSIGVAKCYGGCHKRETKSSAVHFSLETTTEPFNYPNWGGGVEAKVAGLCGGCQTRTHVWVRLKGREEGERLWYCHIPLFPLFFSHFLSFFGHQQASLWQEKSFSLQKSTKIRVARKQLCGNACCWSNCSTWNKLEKGRKEEDENCGQTCNQRGHAQKERAYEERQTLVWRWTKKVWPQHWRSSPWRLTFTTLLHSRLQARHTMLRI